MTKRGLRGLSVAGASLAALMTLSACEKHHGPLPAGGVFGIADKFFDVKALGDNNFLMLGYRSKMFLTGDGGSTWKQVAQPDQRSITRVAFIDANKGWGVGHGGIVFATTDGGTTWTAQTSGTENSLFDVDFIGDTGYAVGDASTILTTTNGGSTWTTGKIDLSMIGVREDMSLAIEDPIFYSVHCLDAQTCWIGGEFGQIRFTEDGGKTWGAQHASLLQGLYRDVMGLPTILSLRMKDRMNGIAVGTNGAILVTSDGGTTWAFGESPVKTPMYDIAYLPGGDSVLVGSSGILLVGNTAAGWKKPEMPSGVYSWLSSVDVDAQGRGIAVGAHGLVLTTANGGRNWEWKVPGAAAGEAPAAPAHG